VFAPFGYYACLPFNACVMDPMIVKITRYNANSFFLVLPLAAYRKQIKLGGLTPLAIHQAVLKNVGLSSYTFSVQDVAGRFELDRLAWLPELFSIVINAKSRVVVENPFSMHHYIPIACVL
jgi:hypothetical protein